MRISDWSSDVCSSDLDAIVHSIPGDLRELARQREQVMPLLLAMLLGNDQGVLGKQRIEIASRMGNEVAEATFGLRGTLAQSLYPMQRLPLAAVAFPVLRLRSEEHTSELQSLMRISYAVFCLKKKKTPLNITSVVL